MADNWQKKERESKKQQQKKNKEQKKQLRKENKKDGNDLDSMIAYIDENGNLSSKPADPSRKKELAVEDIIIGVPKQQPVNPEDLIRTGTVSFFNTAKGFGFINDQKSGQRIFVHANALEEMIQEGNKVSFEIQDGPKGPVAANIKIIK